MLRSLPVLIAAGFLSAGLPQPVPVAPFPRDGGSPVLSNARVDVWVMEWNGAAPTALHRHERPLVGVVLRPGAVTMTTADGTATERKFGPAGEVFYSAAGTTHKEERASEPGARLVLIELKDAAPGASTIPSAADLEGAGGIMLVDNERIRAWDFRFTPGRDVPMHRHGLDSIVIALGDGRIRSTPPDGPPGIVTLVTGEVRFRPGGRTHSESVVDGSPRTIVVELK